MNKHDGTGGGNVLEPHHAAGRLRTDDERAALIGMPLGSFHIGRTWSGHPIEDDCPCPKAPCGLVETRAPECDQHTFTKTMRQGHPAADCPGVAA
jgi:hypothetical protein